MGSIKQKKIVNVIIDGLYTYDQDAVAFEIVAEDLENSYKTTVTVETVDDNLIKIQGSPVVIPVYLDHEFRYTSCVIDNKGNKSVPQIITKEISFFADPVSGLSFEMLPYGIKATPTVPDNTVECEWIVKTDNNTPAIDDLAQYTTKKDTSLFYECKCTNNSSTYHFFVRTIDAEGRISEWYHGSKSGSIKVDLDTEISGAGALASKDSVDLSSDSDVINNLPNTKVSGLGSLATQNKVDLSSDVAGSLSQDKVENLPTDLKTLNNKTTNLDTSGNLTSGKVGSLDVSNANNEIYKDFGNSSCDDDTHGKVFLYGKEGNNGAGGIGILKVLSVAGSLSTYALLTMFSKPGSKNDDDWILGFKNYRDSTTCKPTEDLLKTTSFEYGITNKGKIIFEHAELENLEVPYVLTNKELVKVILTITGNDTDSDRTVNIQIADWGNNYISDRFFINVWHSTIEYGAQTAIIDVSFSIDSNSKLLSSDDYDKSAYAINRIVTNSDGTTEINIVNDGGTDKTFYLMVEIQNRVYSIEVTVAGDSNGS